MNKLPFKIKELQFDKKSKNTSFFPLPLRCIILGASGCGKTTLLYHLITKSWGIPFLNLYIFSPSMEQPIYSKLKEAYRELSTLEGKEIAYFFENCSDIIPVDECKNNSLVVFDDCVNIRDQNVIMDYFVRGRHKNISCVYLSQNYVRIDKQLIRGNANFLCVFEQQPSYIKYIYDEFVGSDFTYNDFKKICENCWRQPHGFLFINRTKELHNGRYYIS